jgi:hypothetical protein
VVDAEEEWGYEQNAVEKRHGCVHALARCFSIVIKMESFQGVWIGVGVRVLCPSSDA